MRPRRNADTCASADFFSANSRVKIRRCSHSHGDRSSTRVILQSLMPCQSACEPACGVTLTLSKRRSERRIVLRLLNVYRSALLCVSGWRKGHIAQISVKIIPLSGALLRGHPQTGHMVCFQTSHSSSQRRATGESPLKRASLGRNRMRSGGFAGRRDLPQGCAEGRADRYSDAKRVVFHQTQNRIAAQKLRIGPHLRLQRFREPGPISR